MPDLLTGDEPIHSSSKPYVDDLGSATIRDFWRWAYSDVMLDDYRAIVAEFLVARLIGEADHPPPDTSEYDILTKEGLRVEVKSSALKNSWYGPGESNDDPRFGDLKRHKYIGKEKQDGPKDYRADIYVFCFHVEEDPGQLDTLDLDQWLFWVLSREQLADLTESGMSVAPGRLEKGGYQPMPASDLRPEFRRIVEAVQS